MTIFKLWITSNNVQGFQTVVRNKRNKRPPVSSTAKAAAKPARREVRNQKAAVTSARRGGSEEKVARTQGGQEAAHGAGSGTGKQQKVAATGAQGSAWTTKAATPIASATKVEIVFFNKVFLKVECFTKLCICD